MRSLLASSAAVGLTAAVSAVLLVAVHASAVTGDAAGTQRSQSTVRTRSARAGLAAARWSAPETIAARGLGTPDTPPAVALDANGDGVAVWSETTVAGHTLVSVVRAAEHPAGGRWRPSTLLSGGGYGPRVAVDASGDAFAVWQASSSPFEVQAAVRPAGFAWVGRQSLSGSPGEQPQVAADTRGDVIVAWSGRRLPGSSGGATGIQAETSAAGGAFGSVEAISRAENAFYPRIAINGRGDAIVSWEVDTPRGCLVRATFRPVNGRWGAPRTLSDTHPGCPARQQVAIDAHGEAIVTWVSQRGRTSSVEAVARTARGRWSARRIIGSSPIIDSAAIAMDARGDALVVWSEPYYNFTIKAAARPAGGGWRAARKIPQTTGLNPSVALDARGNALLAWQGNGGIEVRALRAGGRWQRAQTVSRRRPSDTPPLAALDAHGDGLLAWQDNRGIETAWHSSLFR